MAKNKPNTDSNDEDDVSDDAKHGHVKVKINWVRWENMEEMIESHNVKWEYVKNVPLSEVDWRKSRENHARIGARINTGNVESMVIQGRTNGRLTLPALVGWRPGGPGTKIVLNDGVNRYAFTDRVGATHADMYLLIAPGPNAADAVTRGANGIVGYGSSPEEVVQKGIALYKDNPGCSYAWAARKARMSTGILIQRLRADTLAKRFTVDGDLPVPGASAFNNTVRANLAKIANDIVLQHAAKQLLTVPHYGQKHADALQQMVKKARPNTQESQLLAVDAEIARQIAEVKSAGPRRGPMSTQGKVINGLRQCIRTLEDSFADKDPKDVLRDPDQRKAFPGLAKQLRAIMLRVERGLS